MIGSLTHQRGDTRTSEVPTEKGIIHSVVRTIPGLLEGHVTKVNVKRLKIKAEKDHAKKRRLVSQPLKKEEEESNETLLETKNRISLKIEKIIDMKKDLE